MDEDQVTYNPCNFSAGRFWHVAHVVLSPGLHSSRTKSPTGAGTWLGSRSCSNPVPPPGNRTKRFVMGAIKWEPGRKDRAPFSRVHFSNAIQNPSAVGGEVYLYFDQ